MNHLEIHLFSNASDIAGTILFPPNSKCDGTQIFA